MDVPITYWLDLFTIESWGQFLADGGDVSGFSDGKWPVVQHMNSGDLLLCHLSDSSRWVGILEVTGSAYYEETLIADRGNPSRVPVKVVVELKPESGLPVLAMRNELTVFEYPDMWSLAFRDSPALWRASDGEAVVAAVQLAEADPLDPLSAPNVDLAVTAEEAAARVVFIHNADPGVSAHRGECFGYDPFRPQKSTRVSLGHPRRGYICVSKGKTIDSGSFVQLATLLAGSRTAQKEATP